MSSSGGGDSGAASSGDCQRDEKSRLFVEYDETSETADSVGNLSNSFSGLSESRKVSMQHTDQVRQIKHVRFGKLCGLIIHMRSMQFMQFGFMQFGFMQFDFEPYAVCSFKNLLFQNRSAVYAVQF